MHDPTGGDDLAAFRRPGDWTNRRKSVIQSPPEPGGFCPTALRGPGKSIHTQP